MCKWTDDNARARAIEARHNNFAISFVALMLAVVLLGATKGCTDYNIERVKHPVKYEQIDTYERGGNN